MAWKKKLSLNVAEWQFEFQQREFHPVLMADLWCRALWSNYEKEVGLPVGGLDYLFTGSSKGYVRKTQKERVLAALKEATKKKYFDYISQTTQKRLVELDEFATYCLNRIREKDIQTTQLETLWRDFNLIFLKVIPWFYIPWYLTEENIFSDRVKIGLEKHKEKVSKITDLNNALMVLILPTKELAFQQEQKDFYELVEIAQENHKFKHDSHFLSKAQKYLDYYDWMKTFALLPIEPLTLQELLEKVKKATQDKSLEEYRLQQQQKKKNEKLAKQLLREIGDDEELMVNIEGAKTLGWLLTRSVEQALLSLARLIPFYKLIAQRIGVPYEHWIHLTAGEISQLLRRESNVIAPVTIKERAYSYVFLMESGTATLLAGVEARDATDWIDAKIGAIKINIGEFKGQSACPGRVVGKVKVALFAKDSHRVKEGEILVCSMTSPDYVPAMKLAAAIVTDEGGLLSHAAIVSRELKKPCIVGTKIATQVLKDGDFIEVDAMKGIVRKIK